MNTTVESRDRGTGGAVIGAGLILALTILIAVLLLIWWGPRWGGGCCCTRPAANASVDNPAAPVREEAPIIPSAPRIPADTHHARADSPFARVARVPAGSFLALPPTEVASAERLDVAAPYRMTNARPTLEPGIAVHDASPPGDVVAVPEPGSFGTLLLGSVFAFGLAATRRKWP